METCQATLSRGWRSVGQPAKLAFAASLLSGVLAYLFALTNLFFCVGDALTNTVFDGNLVWLGRWSSAWLSALGTDASMPLVNGLLALIAVALLSAIVVELLELRSTLCVLLAAVVLTCNPTVGDTLKYLHNADGYLIAAMLSALGLLLTDRRRLGFLAGVPLWALAIGTYQACASFVIALMLVRGVQLILQGKRSLRELLLLALRYALSLAAALGLYYVLTGVFSRASGIPLTEYQSVSRMGQTSPSALWTNFCGCYRDFKAQITYLSNRPGFFVSGYPNYLFFVVMCGLCLLIALLRRPARISSVALLAALLALSPMLLCAIRMFNPDTVYSLMTYSVAGLYLLGVVGMEAAPAAIADLRALPWRAWRARAARFLLCAATWVLLLCLIVCFYAWIVGENLDYYNARMDYERVYAICGAYLAAVESAEGYQPGVPIYVIGEPAKTSPAFSHPKYYYAFFRYYLKADLPSAVMSAVDAEALRLSQTEAFDEMPCYPSPGCCQILEGAAVLKLGASGE